MRNYELMYIIRPDFDEEKVAEVIEKYNNLIANNGGEVVTADKWGKRRLAYEIKDFHEGIYVLVNFNGVPDTSREIDRVMKISDDVIRFMIINKDK